MVLVARMVVMSPLQFGHAGEGVETEDGVAITYNQVKASIRPRR